METTRRPAIAGILTAFVLLVSSTVFAQAPVGVSFVLEGCRNNGSVTFPPGGPFVCAATLYTSGNLGKGWNELDLVPHHAILHAGNSAPATQSFDWSVAGDNCASGPASGYPCADGSDGVPGYDFLSPVTLNVGESDAGCPAAQNGPFAWQAGLVGGSDISIFRSEHVDNFPKNHTCVYDFYERLALGAHLNTGASLHANLLFPGGEKDVPLPIHETLAQGLRKDVSAVANASVAWDITKNSDVSTESFGDVCAANATNTLTATVHVVWTKSSPNTTDVVATAHIFANNPSARPITVTVDDSIYQGLTQTLLLSEQAGAPVVVPAKTELEVFTHTVNLPAGSGNVGDSLNDVALASYEDTISGFPIPGTTTAVASGTIGTGTVQDNIATVGDSESIFGNGLLFSVPPPSEGSFVGGYVAGTQTVGPVVWTDQVSASGSITFNKTVYNTPFLITNGVLSDTATLDTVDQSLQSNPVNITFSSTASVALDVTKTIPPNYLQQPGDVLHVILHVTGNAGYDNLVPFDFSFGGPLTLVAHLPGLTPQTFSVDEAFQQFCDTANGCTFNTLLQPANTPVTVDLSPVNGSMAGRCSGTANVVNIFAPQGIRVQAAKVTSPVIGPGDPDFSWVIHLSGPTTCDDLTVGANAGALNFQHNGSDCLLGDGPYVMTEVQHSPAWIQTDVPQSCSFSVDNIFDDGKTFSCTFHNRQLARATLFKTKSGAPDLSATDDFVFQLRQGATVDSLGTVLATFDANLADGFGGQIGGLLMPGQTYQFCELVMPGWKTSLVGTFIPDSNNPGDPLFDSSVMCVNFVLGDGEIRNFLVDNTPPVNPLSGRTIGFWKNWSSCARSNGHQLPILDQTIAAMDPAGVVLGAYYALHAGDCVAAVNLLSKTSITGVKKAGDPIFNMVAQMIAVELNIQRGDFACNKVTVALSQAQTLLTKYHFTGDKYIGTINKADQVTINNLATEFDNYNNDKPSACL